MKPDSDDDDIHLLQLSMRKRAVRYVKYRCANSRKSKIIFLVLFLIAVLLMLTAIYYSRQPADISNVDVNAGFEIATNFKRLMEKRAYVTLYIPTTEYLYFSSVILWIANLRYFNVTDDILVLTTNDVNTVQLDILLHLKVDVRIVPKLSSSGGHPWWREMLTKIALWTLIDYDQVAYYDSDHVYMKSPVALFDECGQHTFCACRDTGPGMQGGYLNAGFMVIHPNLTIFKHLQKLSFIANNMEYAEQSMVNIIFKDKWKEIDEKYNLMMVDKEKALRPGVVAIHDKWWRFKYNGLDDPVFVWNQLRYNYSFVTTFDNAFPPSTYK